MPQNKPQYPRLHRGTLSNPEVRYRQDSVQAVDDGWFSEDIRPCPATQIIIDNSRSIISRNTSPDIPFSQSINPYRGCEHGCIYCYARPSHAYLDMSPGLDFETRILAKPDAAKLLRAKLARKNYACSTMALGSNTFMSILLPAPLLGPFTLGYRMLIVYLPAAAGAVVLLAELRPEPGRGPVHQTATPGRAASTSGSPLALPSGRRS